MPNLITLDQLRKSTGATPANAARWLDAINQTLERFAINTPARIGHFLPQLGHESMGLARTKESFDYRADRLIPQFNTRRNERFTLSQTYKYGRVDGKQRANQEMIGAIAYANRLGNGSIESREGFIYCGRGLIQLTGKANYAAASKFFGVDFVAHPELVEMSPWGALVAGWFWHVGNSKGINLNTLADRGQVTLISQAINGGDNGLTARADLTRAALLVCASCAIA